MKTEEKQLQDKAVETQNKKSKNCQTGGKKNENNILRRRHTK